MQRPFVKLDDRFFDLGGNPALAEQLFGEVGKITGRQFPAVSIYHMDSLVAMASVLEDSTTPRFPPPILLKPGVENPPVFLAHGIGASILDFHPLVEHIQTRRAIYGIQSRGIYGAEAPHQSIEDMAQFHLEAIRKTQAAGPYTLIGYSLGGLVMLEVARNLLADGERIDLLVLVDSYPYRAYLRFGEKVRLYSRLGARRIKRLLGFQSQESRSRADRTAEAIERMQNQGEIEPSQDLAARYELERECAYMALKGYQPRFYNGEIKFLRAAIPTDFPANAEAVWRHLAKQLEMKTVHGDHLGILLKNFESLAFVLSNYLAETNTTTMK